MDLPEPEELTKSPDDDKKFSRDSYLSPTFLSHGKIVAWAALNDKYLCDSASQTLAGAARRYIH